MKFPIKEGVSFLTNFAEAINVLKEKLLYEENSFYFVISAKLESEAKKAIGVNTPIDFDYNHMSFWGVPIIVDKNSDDDKEFEVLFKFKRISEG